MVGVAREPAALRDHPPVGRRGCGLHRDVRPAGKARITILAAGAALPMPAPVDGQRLFTVDPAVTLQLVNDETDRCRIATFARRT